MRPTLLRILKHGLPTAVGLAVIGYLMAEVAGMWVAGKAPDRSARVTPIDGSEPPAPVDADPADSMRVRLPLTMAAWGFGLVAAFELVLWWWRGNAPPPAPAPAANQPGVPSEDEVEQLLNQLLQQAEAAEAARKGGVAPASPPADNTPTPSADRPG